MIIMTTHPLHLPQRLKRKSKRIRTKKMMMMMMMMSIMMMLLMMNLRLPSSASHPSRAPPLFGERSAENL